MTYCMVKFNQLFAFMFWLPVGTYAERICNFFLNKGQLYYLSTFNLCRLLSTNLVVYVLSYECEWNNPNKEDWKREKAAYRTSDVRIRMRLLREQTRYKTEVIAREEVRDKLFFTSSRVETRKIKYLIVRVRSRNKTNDDHNSKNNHVDWT